MDYAEFEPLVIPTGQDHATRHRSFDKESQTSCSVGYYIVSTFPHFNKGYKHELGEGCVKWFSEEKQDFVKEAMKF